MINDLEKIKKELGQSRKVRFFEMGVGVGNISFFHTLNII